MVELLQEYQVKLVEGVISEPETYDITDIYGYIKNLKEYLFVTLKLPVFIISVQFYTVDGETVDSFDINLRNNRYDTTLCKKQAHITMEGNIYLQICKVIGQYLDEYMYYKQLSNNLQIIQGIFDELVEKNAIAFKINFEIGDTVSYVSDDEITIGISEDILINFSKNIMYKVWNKEELSYIQTMHYYDMLEDLADCLNMCMHPIDITQIYNENMQKLGLYKGVNPAGLIRHTALRKLNHTRVGVGYFKDKDIIALIRKQSCTYEEAQEIVSYLSEEEFLLRENVNPTKAEYSKGQKYILYTFCVKPRTPKTMLQIDLSVEDIVDMAESMEMAG